MKAANMNGRQLAHNSYQAMKQRCLNKAHAAYKYYGARGIKICDRWFASFRDFLTDMGERPSIHHCLGRIDHDNGYEPGNCKWITKSENSSGVLAHKIGVPMGVTLRVRVDRATQQQVHEAATALGIPRSELVRQIIRNELPGFLRESAERAWGSK